MTDHVDNALCGLTGYQRERAYFAAENDALRRRRRARWRLRLAVIVAGRRAAGR